jgi:hypothetical protein
MIVNNRGCENTEQKMSGAVTAKSLKNYWQYCRSHQKQSPSFYLKHPKLSFLTRHGIEKAVGKDCFLGTARGITGFRYLVPLLRNPPIHDEFLRDTISRGDRSKDMFAATSMGNSCNALPLTPRASTVVYYGALWRR